MSSHLDNARKELTAQRRFLAHEVADLNRQLRKIDKALEHLAPIDGKIVNRNRPDNKEIERRLEVLAAFYDDMIAKPLVAQREFDMDDLLDHTGEPQELRGAFVALVRKDRDHFETIKRGVYRAVQN